MCDSLESFLRFCTPTEVHIQQKIFTYKIPAEDFCYGIHLKVQKTRWWVYVFNPISSNKDGASSTSHHISDFSMELLHEAISEAVYRRVLSI